MKEVALSTYIINLKDRKDRKAHILKEFAGRDEFNLNVIKACEHQTGAIGLWNTIIHILQKLTKEKEEYIIVCEDDHQFEKNYSRELLFQCINEAQEKEVDILSGGVSWFRNGIEISKNLFWVEKFSGLQFTVIFKKFYNKILNADFAEGDSADYKISSLTENKFVIYPFISTQKEFGYSDVTKSNNQKGFVSKIFKDCAERFELLKKISNFYRDIDKGNKREQCLEYINKSFNNVVLPVYVINLKEREERLTHILRQFEGKKEFELYIVEACKHKLGTLGLWKSIIKIIQIALENDDDFIILCEDDHLFTDHYDKTRLMRNILEARLKGVELLSGGLSGGFDHVVPVCSQLFWVNYFWGLQFTVIYSSLFKKILDYPFTEQDTADGVLSELTSNKMVMFPFISIQQNFGYSDVTKKNHLIKNWVTELFVQSEGKMEIYKNIYEKYVLR